MTFNAGTPIAALLLLSLTAGCAPMQSFGFASVAQDVPIPKGPPIEDVVTPFDEALECIRGKIDPSISFAVGQVIDATGKETYADGGSGKMLSQGAGEMVQTALFRAGVRRNPPARRPRQGASGCRRQKPLHRGDKP